MKHSVWLGLLWCALIVLGWPPKPAAAIPAFAHRFKLQCQACHTEVPHLTAFGERFLASGYRIGSLKPGAVFPVSFKFQGAYSSAPANPAAPLPKTILDEIEVLSGGAIGNRASYFFEVYALDGGFPGRPREIWAATRLSPDGATVPFTVRAGQFVLPLPIDAESFRETTDHFAIWDQTGGANGFNFFDPKIGVQFAAGNPARGFGVTLNALQGHDIGGMPARSVDTEFTVQHDFGPWSLFAYRYDGTRTVAPLVDRFWRNGYGLAWTRGGTRVDAVYQTGNDSAADAFANALQTSGGFVQIRQEAGPRAFAIARWDATSGGAFTRSFIAGGGYRPTRNSRVTVWDTLAPNGMTGGVQHTLSSSLLVAY